MSTELPASAYIDIAPNEYVTKYSFNRNFEKLLSNDTYLYDTYSVGVDPSATEIEKLKKIQTYNKLKTYSQGEFVFYKIKKSDTKFYILKSKQGPNTHKPTVRKNIMTDDLYVVNSDWWVIVGAQNEEKGTSFPKDQADMYVNSSRSTFQSNHESNNETLSAHPTGKLSLQDSTKAFKSLENISEDRTTVHYPSYLQSFVADNTTYSGYMRKWDNGLLEYDLTFHLGYISSDSSGIDIISANNLVVSHRNKNFMYFQTNDDYNIFNKGGEKYVVTPTSKQVNLNTEMNAYTGTIRFVEPFKDLNYMVFTSNVKNIETEAYNLKNEAIDAYDKRLILDGRQLVGHQVSAVFLNPCTIPDDVINITRDALADIKQVDGFPVKFNMSPWTSRLVNIDQNAFMNSDIEEISIPASTRYIGTGAFSNCTTLTCVNFYVYADDISSQVRIDQNAFPRTVLSVHIYKRNKNGFSASSISHEDAFLENVSLYDKLNNPNYRAFIGMNPVDNAVNVKDEGYVGMTSAPSLMRSLAPAIENDAKDAVVEVEAIENDDPNVFTIDVKAFLEELNAASQQKKLKSSTKMMFAATKPEIDINNVFLMNESHAISGFNSTGIVGNVSYDLRNLTTKPTSIQENALYGFTNLTGLTLNNELTSLSPNALPTSLRELNVNVVAGKSYQLSITTNIEQLSVYESSTPTSLQISSQYGIDDIYINANQKNIPSTSFYVPAVDNLYVNRPSVIGASAFWNISSLQNCIITSNESTTINANIFRYDIDEEDNISYAMSEQLKLVGNKWIVSSYGLAGVNTQSLSIDATGSKFNANSFFGLDTSFFVVKNIDDAISENQGSLTYRGFQAQALLCTEITQLAFDGISINDISSTYFPNATMKNIGVSDVLVRGSETDAMLYFESSSYEIFSSNYFNLDANSFISSLNISNISADNVDFIAIPRGVAGIGDNVFNASITTALTSSISINIDTIFIPNTVEHIGENAFKNLSTLTDIDFEPGIQLSSIGLSAFSGCTSLKDMQII